jgi:hypothetical protein
MIGWLTWRQTAAAMFNQIDNAAREEPGTDDVRRGILEGVPAFTMRSDRLVMDLPLPRRPNPNLRWFAR